MSGDEGGRWSQIGDELQIIDSLIEKTLDFFFLSVIGY